VSDIVNSSLHYYHPGVSTISKCRGTLRTCIQRGFRTLADQIGIGIVGAGIIGNVHAYAFSEMPEAKIIGVAEPREDAGKQLAEKTGGKWYASYVELLENPDIDLIVLATPSGMHPDQAVLASRAGKHVITEKPMAITSEGATRMIEAAREAGTHLAVVFQNRLAPDVVRVKRAIEAGYIGKPIFGNAFVHWKRTQEYYDANGGWRGTWALDGGGALINQSIHTIDLLQWTLGGVDTVQAHAATLRHNIEAEDTASASVKFISGALGVIQGTTASGGDNPVKLEIIGEQGKVVVEGGQVTTWQGTQELSDDLLTEEDHALTDGWRADEKFGEPHRRQFRQIIKEIQANGNPPFAGTEARKAVDLILSIYESARTGTRVSVPRGEG
jgi:UDP-N-acetyl-2-amino-2-deoxyglucuronate dehydrogenase